MKGFVSGLVCGEGNFSISITRSESCRLGYHVRPIFQIELHSNDAPLLETVRDFFGFGSINYPKPRTRQRNESPTCKYVVTSISDCLALSRFFTENPLIGVKQRGFEVWTECLAIIASGEHTSSEGFRRIAEKRDQINHIRRPSTHRGYGMLAQTTRSVAVPRKLGMWSKDEEALVLDYLNGAITRQELREQTGRHGPSLDNKISRMRKRLAG
jgi:LAGLIDADG endonuclease